MSGLAEAASGPAPARATGRGLQLAVTLASVALLGFVAGGLAVLGETYPGRALKSAYHAGTALRAKVTLYNEPFQLDLWRPARTASRGVTVHDRARAWNGLTLYTSGHAQKAFLLDMEGRVAHEWDLPYSRVWDATAAVRWPQPDTHIYIEKAFLYPNGDLLAIYVAVGDTPWGYGLVKMDRASRILWKYLAHAHHDVDVAADGRIYLLTQEIGTDDLPQLVSVKPPRIDDYVVVLSPEGIELERVRVLDALLGSRYAYLVDTVPWYTVNGSGDYLHTNGIDVLDGKAAGKLPQASAGRVLLSFREISTLAILDLAERRIVWATLGPWLRQHDPDLLPTGDILLFDNQGNPGPGGITRLIELDPQTHAISWTYAGSSERPFDSPVRSSQQRLPNGNTLVTESDGGRLFEVTAEGEVVWEYLNPVRGGDREELIPIVAWAQRAAPAELDPDFLASLPRLD